MHLRRSILLALVVVVATLGGVGSARAHSGIQSYIFLSLYDGTIEGRVEYPIGDLAAALDIELPENRDAAFATVQQHADEIVAYTDRHLQFANAGESWPLRFDHRMQRLDIGLVDYVQVLFTVERSFVDTPRTWSVTYTGIIEDNPERDALLLIEDDWQTATFRNGSDHLVGFSVGNETQLVELDDVSTLESLREIARRGSIAVDRSEVQVLVLLAVLLAAGVPRSGPRTWRAGTVRIAKRTGALIIGQSLALWLLALTGAGLTSRRALATAALGGLVAAATSRLAGRPAIAACGGIGLLTGIALGSTFVDLQLGRTRPIASVLAFDLGATVTVVFVTLLFAPMALLLARHRRAPLIADAVAALAPVVGLIWLIDRSAGLGLPLRRAGFAVADLATSPLVITVATCAVAWLTLRETTPPADVDPTRTNTERIEIT